MKALTIKQPYAHLVACGIKDIENRSWQTKYRGRILIHAAATEFKGGWNALTQSQKHEARFNVGDTAHMSAIIGSVEIVDCVKNHPSIWANEGEWNWVFANPIIFKEPILNVKGKLSLWEYTGEIPDLQQLSDSIYYSECKRTARGILEKLTQKEQMQVSFAPLIYIQIAWHYAFQACEEAKKDRVEMVKRLCRTIRNVYQEYNVFLGKDLDYDHIKHIENETKNVLCDIRMDLLKLYFAINNEFKRVYPNEKYDKMRSYAIMSELVITLLAEHNKDMDKLLFEKQIKNNLEPTEFDYHTEKLIGLIKELSSIDKSFNMENQSIQIGLEIIKRRIQAIKFNVI